MTENGKLPECEYNKLPLKEIGSEKHDTEIPKYGYGIRHIQCAIFLTCLTTVYIARGHLSVTVVAMTSQDEENALRFTISNDSSIATNITLPNLVNITRGNLNNLSLVDIKGRSYKTYPWPKSTQEMILGSFSVGYFIMMMPIGMVCQRWGGKLPLQIALFVNAFVSILTPWLTFWGGWKAVCACRILQGLSQAGTYPSIQTLLARWVPVSERATMSSYVYTGTSIGNIIAFQLAGLLGDSRWGWPSTYWAVGVACFLSFVLITVFGAASPIEHKTISKEETEFILGKMDIRKPKTPWRAIFTSIPVWGTFATHIGSGICFIFFFNQVPSYIHYILGIDVKSSGLLSALPFIGSFVSSLVYGWTSDYLTNKKIISVKTARQLFNSISLIGLALLLICVTYSNNVTIAVVCLVMAMSLHSGVHSGWMICHLDMAPNFSGTLMSVGNTLTNVLAILMPFLISYVITDRTNPTQWQIMIYVIAGMAVVTNAIFVFFMSAEIQPWNFVDQDDTTIEDQELKKTKK